MRCILRNVNVCMPSRSNRLKNDFEPDRLTDMPHDRGFSIL